MTVKSEAEITDSTAPGDGTPGKGEMLAPNSPALTATAAASLTISGGNIVCSKDSAYTVRTEEGASTTVCGSARIVSEKYRTLYLYG